MRKQALNVVLLGLICSLQFTGCDSGGNPPKNPNSGMVELENENPGKGLIEDEGVQLVRINCLGCHSEKLITQNRATREGWEYTIEWMQETQNLWDLGENEKGILDYLARNYAPVNKGRRAPLKVEWYELPE